MNISQQLARIVEQTHSLDRLLDAAVVVVGRQMRCDACSIFLLDLGERTPRLRACFREGAAPACVLTPDVAARLAMSAVSCLASEATQAAGRSLLAIPMVLRDLAVGAILVENASDHVFSEDEISALTSAAAQLVGIVVSALLIDARARRQGDVARLGLGPDRRERAVGEVVVQGTAACPGVGIGRAAFRGVHDLTPEVRSLAALGEEAEKARLRDALVKTRNDIARLQRAAAHDIDEEHALIFGSHLLLMNDPALIEQMDRSLASGVSAPVAIDDALKELEAHLGAASDTYFRERMEDIDDLRGRLLSHVLDARGRSKHGGHILVSRHIPPSLVVELKAEQAAGIVTEIGGVTSHGVLLARALGIPAVTGVADLLDSIEVGDEMIVDGETGKVVLRPSTETLAAYRERIQCAARLRTEYAKYRDRPLQTADGLRVRMLANVAVASDLVTARDNGAEGIGLYRTEFPFIVREQFPTREEQVRIYRKAYDSFPDGPINFRVLDLGGDKFLRGNSLGTPHSPFHGYRGIRVLFDHPHILRDQVQAFALAAAGRALSILIPMVTSMDELRRTREIIADALLTLPRSEARPALALGVMIEAPGAVDLAPDLAREVDYLSIGTNDLVQYALVVDREDPRMSSPRDAYHPAILRMVRRTVVAAHAVDRPVSVCGEMAARSDLAAALVALGVDALSVVPTVIPEIKQALASVEIGRLRAAMDEVLASGDASTLEATLRWHLRPQGDPQEASR